MRISPRGPQNGYGLGCAGQPLLNPLISTMRWRNHDDSGKDRGPGGHSEDSGCAQLCRSRASSRSAMEKLQVRFEPSSPRISTEDEQIISTWAKGECGGEGEGCQRKAAVQIPLDSSPAAPTSPVIPQNKLQSKQGAQDPAIAATPSSFRSIFPSSPPHLLLGRCIYASCPELDLQGRCLSEAQESWLGPRRKGKRRASQKPSDRGFI